MLHQWLFLTTIKLQNKAINRISDQQNMESNDIRLLLIHFIIPNQDNNVLIRSTHQTVWQVHKFKACVFVFIFIDGS